MCRLRPNSGLLNRTLRVTGRLLRFGEISCSPMLPRIWTYHSLELQALRLSLSLYEHSNMSAGVSYTISYCRGAIYTWEVRGNPDGNVTKLIRGRRLSKYRSIRSPSLLETTLDIIDLDRGGDVYRIAETKVIVVVRCDSLAAIRIVRDAERSMYATVSPDHMIQFPIGIIVYCRLVECDRGVLVRRARLACCRLDDNIHDVLLCWWQAGGKKER